MKTIFTIENVIYLVIILVCLVLAAFAVLAPKTLLDVGAVYRDF